MGAFLGLLTSFSITGSEMFGRRVSNELGPSVAAAGASVFAAIVGVVVALVIPGALIGRDLLLGAASGVGFGFGMVTYFQGVRVASSAVIAPTVGALSTVVPFGYTAVVDAVPSSLAIGGAIAAVMGLVLITAGGAPASNVRVGLRWGVVAGVAYGLGSVFIIETTSAAGAWPAVSQRAVAFTIVLGLALSRRRRLWPPATLRLPMVGTGVLAACASLCLLAGLQADPAAASVTASLFPATSVAGGRLLYGDSVATAQTAGLLVVLAGVIAVVAG